MPNERKCLYCGRWLEKGNTLACQACANRRGK
jgi:DNA-directed RNA polymerase subunit RPC12/RpoP